MGMASAVTERVLSLNPWLAKFDTCRRMSSIEVVSLASRGSGRPSTSQRILGFRVDCTRVLFSLFARHPVEKFIRAPLEDSILNVAAHPNYPETRLLLRSLCGDHLLNRPIVRGLRIGSHLQNLVRGLHETRQAMQLIGRVLLMSTLVSSII